MSRWRINRRAGILLGMSTVLISCADTARTPMEPRSDSALPTSIVTTSLWQFGDTSLAWVAGASTLVSPAGLGSRQDAAFERRESQLRTQADLSRVRSNVERHSSAAPHALQGTSARALDAPQVTGGSALVRPVLAGRSMTHQTNDGREVEIQLSASSGRNGRPPAAVAVYVDGRISTFSRFAYKRERGRWAPAAVTVMIFDADGKITHVSVNEISSASAPSVGFGDNTFESTLAALCRGRDGVTSYGDRRRPGDGLLFSSPGSSIPL
jgi:hypothetical protein